MGDNFGDGDPRERPVHVVELDAFFIAKYEMTNGEWKKFRDDAGYDDVKFWPGARVTPKDQIPYWSDARNHGGGTPDSGDYPVLGVNWDSAVAYCNWLSAKTGKKYRLPTEAEWEYASRGGLEQKTYPWGDDLTPDGGQRCNIWQGKFPDFDLGETALRPLRLLTPLNLTITVCTTLWAMCGNGAQTIWIHSGTERRPGSTPSTRPRAIAG